MALGFPRQTHDPQKREFLVNRKLMAGFNTWRTAVATFLEIIQLTVGHWRGQEMMRGWNRWQIRRDDTFRLRAWLEQALRMALAVAAARGWRGWLAMLEIQQEYQCLMRYSLARFMTLVRRAHSPHGSTRFRSRQTSGDSPTLWQPPSNTCCKDGTHWV
jgi:hypothetical protein